MKKVSFVLDGLQIGGVERVCLDYVKIFLNLGYQVTIINLRPELDAMVEEVPKECKILSFPFSRKFAPEQYAQLIKLGGIYKLLYPFISCLLFILNYIYKIYIEMIHKELRVEQDLVIAFSGHFNDLTVVSENYIKAKKKIAWLHGALYGYLLISDGYVNLYNKIKNLIVLVDDAQDEVLVTNKQLKLNIHKLYNPSFIYERKIDKNKVQELKDRFGNFAIMVSRFEYPHKDQYTVVKAFNILEHKYGDHLNLVFVGDGPDFENVKNLYNSLDFHENKVFFEGSKLDVQNYYASAKMLVHASVAGEGLPTVQIEALSYGLPQVVTDSKVGPREILQDNKYGLLCKVKDANDMADKIHVLYHDRELYRLYEKRSSERLKEFEPQKIEKQLKVILNELI